MSEIKEEQVPSTPTLSEKQLKELEMFFQKQSQVRTSAILLQFDFLFFSHFDIFF
jgi:hypothetical protein